jgi:hypothetical protein
MACVRVYFSCKFGAGWCLQNAEYKELYAPPPPAQTQISCVMSVIHNNNLRRKKRVKIAVYDTTITTNKKDVIYFAKRCG